MSELQKILEEIKSKNGDSKQTLHQLLTQLFNKLSLDNPSDCYQAFENYTSQLKLNGYDPELNDTVNRMKEAYDDREKDCTNIIILCDVIFQKINAGTEEDPAEAGPIGYTPNFIQESKWFEWAGIYFGEEEAYKIQRSLMKLSFTKQAKQLRFWGKILGSKKDYYVAEGAMENEDAGELPPDVEPKGQPGVNKLNYWVTNNLLDDWIELPIVTPEQIKLARKIKHIFTGNLEEKVITNPFFYETEKYLLKAQIVRISHSTTIVPKNFYHLTDDDRSFQHKLFILFLAKEIELITEEFKAPAFQDLTSLNSWHHLTSNILNEGRLVHMHPELGADDDEEKIMKEIEAKDPFEPKLKPLSEDQGVLCDAAWSLKTFGDLNTYALIGKVPMQSNYGFILVKSLIWDGAYTMYYKQNWSQIYVGYGFKATEELFYPKYTQQIQLELDEQEDQPEPHLPTKQEQQEDGEEAENNEND